MADIKRSFTDEEALAFHRSHPPGKISITPTKPMATQRDLSLAYSPGVAVPVRAIAEDPDKAYDYTAKGNLVAVISNGTAILGLGNLGAAASKPVMEGKSVLFKRFADVDSIDIEVTTQEVEEFITTVRNIGPTFGGINLEDIKSPECFVIESRLRDELDIPVFHDDQHGTAIIAAAGLINACELTKRKIEDIKVVVNGAGAAGLSVAGLIKTMGARPENVIICDREGVVYRGREKGIDQFKAAHAVDTKLRTLTEALKGADCLMGLSVAGSVTAEMVKGMAKNPIIFAMANPDPEITPEEVHAVRKDAIMAEILIAARICKERHFPFLLSFTSQDDALLDGTDLKEMIVEANKYQPMALLLNCRSTDEITTGLQILANSFDGLTGAYGNGPGHPDLEVGWRIAEGAVAGYVNAAKQWYELGARIIGGCCGTTPQHIQGLAELRKNL
jgi:malic enzyme